MNGSEDVPGEGRPLGPERDKCLRVEEVLRRGLTGQISSGTREERTGRRTKRVGGPICGGFPRTKERRKDREGDLRAEVLSSQQDEKTSDDTGVVDLSQTVQYS